MKWRNSTYMAFIAILVGALICAAESHAQAKKPLEKPQAEAGRTETEAQAYHELSESQQRCIVRMLGASTLTQAKTRKAACKDSFALRAYYASLLIQFHAPGAEEEIVRNMPQNLVDLHEVYPGTFDYDEIGDPAYTLVVQAYEQYYKSLFRIVAERPSLLSAFFRIADRFGARTGDNMDEEGWFCNALHDIYKKNPAAYWRVVREKNNKEYRGLARGCALHPIP